MSDGLERRLTALAEAADLADGRLDPEAVERARAIVARAGARLGLGLESTVVALAGPTGAGKSTLFNALAGSPLADAGRRRPTTAAAAAASWGETGGALLDWLEIPRRHVVEGDGLEGLVLLDLPDFDSVEVSHRLEVERLADLVDLAVWVVDPQKYADASLHDGFLRPLAAYGESMLVVLNQADLLTPDALATCLADLERLLTEDGLDGVPVLAVSATRGEGLEDLRGALAERVRRREAALARLAADVTSAARKLVATAGSGSRGDVGERERERLVDALATAAGVPAVVRAVAVAHRRRGALATGWPFVRWVRRLRPDPLRRLRLRDRPDEAVRTSLPGPTQVQRAQVSAAARALAGAATSGMPDPWPRLARRAAVGREGEAADRLDRAVAGAELHVRRPRWWRLVGVLQALLAVAAVAGALWLLALVGLAYLQLDDSIPTPDAGPIPLPTALLLGGLLAGIVLAWLAGLVTSASARRRSRAAGRALRRRVEAVADELVVEPVERELDAFERLGRALETASTPERPRRGARLRSRLRTG